MKKFDRNTIIERLNEKGAKKPCHRCGNSSFALVEGYSTFYTHEYLQNPVLGGPNIPVVLAVCENCGAMTPHAVGAFFNLNELEKK